MDHRRHIPSWPLPVVATPVLAAAALTVILAVPGPARAHDWPRGLARVADAPAPSLRLVGEDNGPVHADEIQDIAQRLRASGAILPLERVVELAHDRHEGRLLQVELELVEGRYVYEVEFVDDDGLIWAMFFDAASGDVLESMPEAAEGK
jgi:hypothetical protein